MPKRKGSSEPHRVDIFVGKRVAEERVSRGYTQTDLGKALDLTFQQIQKYETGINRISSSKLYLIARFFGLTPLNFFPPMDAADDLENLPVDKSTPVTKNSVRLTQAFGRISSSRGQQIVILMAEEIADREQPPA